MVPRMDALCDGNKFLVSALLDSAQDNSWLFGVTMASNNEMYTILGQHFRKLLVEPGYMAEWAQQSSADLLRAAQFLPQLNLRCC